ncbi:MAG: transporter suffix domain-containing protein [Cytophagia bacterium]|nr:MAG: transporter suffix domain-containing protein [Cytophagia bacterium]
MKKIGYFLFILSILLMVLPFGVPFFPISLWLKGILVVVFLVLGEVFFWVSIVILGKEFLQNFKIIKQKFLQFFVKKNRNDTI